MYERMTTAFSNTLVNVENHSKDTGVFVLEQYKTLAEEEGFDMLQYHKNIGRMLCKIVNGIYHSNSIRDRNNNPIYVDPPACTPQELAELTPVDFVVPLELLRLHGQFLTYLVDSITLWNSLEDSLVHSHTLPQ